MGRKALPYAAFAVATPATAATSSVARRPEEYGVSCPRCRGSAEAAHHVRPAEPVAPPPADGAAGSAGGAPCRGRRLALAVAQAAARPRPTALLAAQVPDPHLRPG